MKNSSQAYPQSRAQLIHRQARLIALENIVVALLCTACEEQLELIRKMAAGISPRPGFTEHPLTIQAATQMNSMVQRARHFRDTQNLSDSPWDLREWSNNR
jgi:hypothetical protein